VAHSNYIHKSSVSQQESISSTFYAQIFCKKVPGAAFLKLNFGFMIFWCKTIGAKVARKKLMKLTPGVP
jgi:hypothetical protein